MKTKHLLLGLLLSFSSYTFAASTDPEILKIPSLKALSEKVDLQIQKLNEAAKSSRSASAEAQANLNSAYAEYTTELKKQKESATSKSLIAAIDKELAAINEKTSAPKSTK